MTTIREYRRWIESHESLWARHVEAVHEYHAEHGYVTFGFMSPHAIGDIVGWAGDPNMGKGATLFEVISEGSLSEVLAQSPTPGWASEWVRNAPYFYRVRAMD